MVKIEHLQVYKCKKNKQKPPQKNKRNIENNANNKYISVVWGNYYAS